MKFFERRVMAPLALVAVLGSTACSVSSSSSGSSKAADATTKAGQAGSSGQAGDGGGDYCAAARNYKTSLDSMEQDFNGGSGAGADMKVKAADAASKARTLANSSSGDVAQGWTVTAQVLDSLQGPAGQYKQTTADDKNKMATAKADAQTKCGVNLSAGSSTVATLPSQ